MDKKANKLSKEEYSIRVERGKYSQYLKSDDDGAYIEFSKMNSIEQLVRIQFGYISTGNHYGREIVLDFDKVVELKNLIDKIIQYESKQQKSFYFFSYGSNLLYQRIHERCPSIEFVKNLRLSGVKLVFNKKSVDGSAKANIIQSRNSKDEVWGVLCRISWNDKNKLDGVEGLGNGYDLKYLFEICDDIDDTNSRYQCYQATDKKFLTSKPPYDWYIRLVLEGAKKNGFPEDYIRHLKTIKSITDKDECRKLKALSVLNNEYALEYYEKCQKFEK